MGLFSGLQSLYQRYGTPIANTIGNDVVHPIENVIRNAGNGSGRGLFGNNNQPSQNVFTNRVQQPAIQQGMRGQPIQSVPNAFAQGAIEGGSSQIRADIRNTAQFPGRAAVASYKTLTNNSNPFTAQNDLQRTFLGTDPITPGQTSSVAQFAQRHGASPLQAKSLGVLGLGASIASNFIPGGEGDSSILDGIAHSFAGANTVGDVAKIATDKGISLTPDLMKTIAQTSDAKAIVQPLADHLLNSGQAVADAAWKVKLNSELPNPTQASQNLPKDVSPGSIEKPQPVAIKPPAISTQTELPSPQLTNPSISPSLPGTIQRPKGLVNTLQESSKTPIEIKTGAAAINPQTYEPLSNATSFASGEARVAANAEAAHQFVLDPANPWNAEKAQTGKVLMNQAAETGNVDKVTELANSMDQQARAAGQGNQALASYGELAPPNLLKVANAEAAKVNQTLSPAFQQQILERSTALQKLTEGSPERVQGTQQLLKDIANQLPPTRGELFGAYRYSNLLSSPTSAMKIAYNGLVNTLVTRPATLVGQSLVDASKGIFNSDFQRTAYLSDAPNYLKAVAQSVPDAIQAAIGGFKDGNMGAAFQEGRSAAGSISMLRKDVNSTSNITNAGNLFPRVHTAIYNFFSTMVSSGETARLMAQGVDQATAVKAGEDLGQKLLLRNKLGVQPNSPEIVKAIDSLGQMIGKWQQNDGIGGQATRVVAPFMKVAVNLAKLQAEYSPLAFVSKGVVDGDAEQIAKASLGSIAMAYGALKASEGKITWAAPKDAKENALFYASGRKPYSVLIGGKWIPMTYFGPFALSMALPAAYNDVVNTATGSQTIGQKTLDMITHTTNFIAAATPLPTIANAISVLQGDTNLNWQKILGQIAGQAIPLVQLQKYVADALDPIYRKTSDFTTQLESNIPGLKPNLPAYTTPTGQPESRNASDFVAPYPVGIPNNQFEPAYQARQQTLNTNAQLNQANKGNTTAVTSGQQVAPGIYQLQDGTFGYQVNNQFKAAKTQADAQLALAKDQFSKGTAAYQVLGDTVLKRGTGNSVTEMPITKFNDTLYTAQLSNYKMNGNISAWMDTAQKQADNLQKQLQDPSLDPAEQLTLQNKLETLTSEAAKYQSYRGFTKPKSSRSGTAAIKHAYSVSKPSVKPFKSSYKIPKIKQPKIKFASVKQPKTSFSKIGKIRQPKGFGMSTKRTLVKRPKNLLV